MDSKAEETDEATHGDAAMPAHDTASGDASAVASTTTPATSTAVSGAGAGAGASAAGVDPSSSPSTAADVPAAAPSGRRRSGRGRGRRGGRRPRIGGRRGAAGGGAAGEDGEEEITDPYELLRRAIRGGMFQLRATGGPAGVGATARARLVARDAVAGAGAGVPAPRFESALANHVRRMSSRFSQRQTASLQEHEALIQRMADRVNARSFGLPESVKDLLRDVDAMRVTVDVEKSDETWRSVAAWPFEAENRLRSVIAAVDRAEVVLKRAVALREATPKEPAGRTPKPALDMIEVLHRHRVQTSRLNLEGIDWDAEEYCVKAAAEITFLLHLSLYLLYHKLRKLPASSRIVRKSIAKQLKLNCRHMFFRHRDCTWRTYISDHDLRWVQAIKACTSPKEMIDWLQQIDAPQPPLAAMEAAQTVVALALLVDSPDVDAVAVADGSHDATAATPTGAAGADAGAGTGAGAGAGAGTGAGAGGGMPGQRLTSPRGPGTFMARVWAAAVGHDSGVRAARRIVASGGSCAGEESEDTGVDKGDVCGDGDDGVRAGGAEAVAGSTAGARPATAPTELTAQRGGVTRKGPKKPSIKALRRKERQLKLELRFFNAAGAGNVAALREMVAKYLPEAAERAARALPDAAKSKSKSKSKAKTKTKTQLALEGSAAGACEAKGDDGDGAAASAATAAAPAEGSKAKLVLDLDKRSMAGTTPLYHAVFKRSVKAVEYLLAAGANPTITSLDGTTPLQVACSRTGQPAADMAEMLMDALEGLGYTPEAVLDISNEQGDTPLHTAARSRDLSLLMELIKCGGNPLAKNSKGKTPLSYVILKYNNIAGVMLSRGARSRSPPTRRRAVSITNSRSPERPPRGISPESAATYGRGHGSTVSGSSYHSGSDAEGNEPALELRQFLPFQGFLDNPALSDVTVVCEGRRINCHRILLCAQSQMFKAMFTGGFREGHESEVEISDVSYKALSKIIQFCYTGHCSLPVGDVMTAAEVLLSAHTLMVPAVFAFAQNSLVSMLSTYTAPALLEQAISLDALRLRDACCRQILAEYVEVDDDDRAILLQVLTCAQQPLST